MDTVPEAKHKARAFFTAFSAYVSPSSGVSKKNPASSIDLTHKRVPAVIAFTSFIFETFFDAKRTSISTGPGFRV
jgi:hypothetical protein